MVDLKDDFYEKNMVKTITQGTIEECREFMQRSKNTFVLLLKKMKD